MAEGDAGGRVSELKIDRSRTEGTRRRRTLLIALFVVLLLLGAGLAWFLTRPPLVRVAQVREARPGEAATALSAAGYVVATRESIVSPQIAGRLNEVLVEEGEQVEQGQVLATLADSDQQIAVQRAEAAALAAVAQLSAAQVQEADASRTLVRTRTLAQNRAATPEELDSARAAFNAARAQRQAASAQLAEARRAVENAKLQHSYTVIRAPFTGTISRKLADEGAVLAPAVITSEANVGGILEMVDLGSLAVDAEVSEDQISRVEVGQQALVFLEAFPGKVFLATTGLVRPAIDRATATGVVRVEFDQRTEGVLPDMAATVSFLEHKVTERSLAEEARLRVPTSAVVERDGRMVVFVLEDGRVFEEPVRVERRVDSEMSLVSGPKPGTRIALDPGEELQDGQRVRAVAEGT